MRSTFTFNPLLFLLLIIGALILVACGSPETVETPSPSAVPTEARPATEVEPTPSEAPTPTSLPGRTLVILVAPPGAEAGLVAELTDTLTELTGSESLDFEVLQTISQQELPANVRLVISLPPDPGLANLAGSAPQTQFLGISIPGLDPATNLSVISSEVISPDQIGFLAGYLAAVVAPEWRVGAISTSDTPEGVSYRQGFLNGVIFFCGLCRQNYPPFNTYPLYVEAPSGSTPQEWQNAGNLLINQAVQTAFIAPGVGDENLLEQLAGADINLIGTMPPADSLKEHWIATISGDMPSALEAIWPDLIAGKGGISQPANLTITNINPDLFSEGRQRLVDNLISELSNGFIDTGVLMNPGTQ
jgi:hypothetical protein